MLHESSDEMFDFFLTFYTRYTSTIEIIKIFNLLLRQKKNKTANIETSYYYNKEEYSFSMNYHNTVNDDECKNKIIHFLYKWLTHPFSEDDFAHSDSIRVNTDLILNSYLYQTFLIFIITVKHIGIWPLI